MADDNLTLDLSDATLVEPEDTNEEDLTLIYQVQNQLKMNQQKRS